MTATERVQKHRAKNKPEFRSTPETKPRDADVARMQAEIDALRTARDAAQAEIVRLRAGLAKAAAEQPKHGAPPPVMDWEARRAAVTQANKAKRAAAAEAKRAAAAATLQADSATPEAQLEAATTRIVDLETQLKAAQTRIRNLRGEMHHVREWHDSQMQRKGGMNFATRAAIAKVLRDDHDTTPAELDNALKLFNQFISDDRRAGRAR